MGENMTTFVDGQVLTAAELNSAFAAPAANLAGGVAGQIPYQTAASTTAFIGAGTTGQVLVSQGGTSAPVFESTLSGLTFNGSAFNGTIGATTPSTGAFTTLTATGTDTAASFIPTGSIVPTNGMFLPSANTVGIATNSTLQAAIDGNGNLNFYGTGKRIVGDFSNATVANRLMFETSTANSITSIHAIPNGTGNISQISCETDSAATNGQYIQLIASGTTDGRIAVGIRGTGTYLPMTFYTGGSERMRLDPSGNLLVGRSSSANLPGPNGNIQISDNIASGCLVIGGFGNYLGRQSSDGSTVLNTAQGSTIFSRGPYGSTAESMRIDSSGNLGLGVIPSAWQSGYKVIQTGAQALMYGNNSFNVWGSNFYTDSTGAARYIQSDYAQIYQQGIGSGIHAWFIAPSGTAGSAVTFTQAMTLDNSGRLLIGATTYSYSYSGGFATFVGPGQIDINIGSTANSNAIVFNNPNGQVGYINTTGTSTVYSTASDQRLKTDLGIASQSRILDLKIHDYEWKSDGSKARGVFAQEAHQVIPEAVTVGSDEVDENGNLTKPWAVDYSKFVPDLIVEIQALRKEIEILKGAK